METCAGGVVEKGEVEMINDCRCLLLGRLKMWLGSGFSKEKAIGNSVVFPSVRIEVEHSRCPVSSICSLKTVGKPRDEVDYIALVRA